MNLTDIPRVAPSVLLAGMRSEHESESKLAAEKLLKQSRQSGLNVMDFLTLAIDPTQGENPGRYEGLNGFEAALLELGLPFRQDLEQGVLLQAASDTFQKYPGTRALFPEVIDAMIRWKNRQDQMESVDKMIAQSRTITGTELVSTVIENDQDSLRTSTIAELGKIPVRTIKSSETSVRIYKHGSGVRTSYEFNRRASLDIMTPYAARVARELQISKVAAATSVLVNGDGVNPAATAKKFTDFGGVIGTEFSKQYKAVAKWLVYAAKNGTPIDTIVGNIDMYLELLFMFTPTLSGAKSEADAIAERGGPRMNVNIPMLGGNVNFVLSSQMPDDKLLGYSKDDTLEELVEAGSDISENERSVSTQSISYYKTENSGYKLAFGDTRQMLDLTQ